MTLQDQEREYRKEKKKKDITSGPPTTAVQYLYSINGMHHYATSCCLEDPHFGIATSTSYFNPPGCGLSTDPNLDTERIETYDSGHEDTVPIDEYGSFLNLPNQTVPALNGEVYVPIETSIETIYANAQLKKSGDDEFNTLFENRRFAVNEVRSKVSVVIDSTAVDVELFFYMCDSCRRPETSEPNLELLEVAAYRATPGSRGRLFTINCGDRAIRRPLFVPLLMF